MALLYVALVLALGLLALLRRKVRKVKKGQVVADEPVAWSETIVIEAF